MPDKRDSLRPYIADMLALDKHIVEALERQQKDDDVRQFPAAGKWVDKTLDVLRGHVQILEKNLEGYQGGSAAGAVKGAVTGVLGAIAEVYDKIRKDAASRALRDDYTALSLAAISATMLHTAALGLRQGATADIALRHLKALTPLIVELSEIVPPIVLRELSFEGHDIETGLAEQAVRSTHQAWRQEKGAETAAAGTPIGSTVP
jgi:hypothetical protein